jgi:hypothetical protein
METILHTAPAPGARTASPAPTLSLTERLLVRRTLLGGLALGVVGDTLLRAGASGVGFTLFVLATLGALAGLMRARRAPWTLGACLLLAPTLFFAVVYVWRDSPALGFYNFLALGAAMAALATALLRGEEWEPMSSAGGYLRGARRVALGTAIGGGLLLRDSEGGRELATPGRLRHAGAVGRGAVLSIPLLLVFGSLLTSADPVFARLVQNAFDIDFDAVASHLIGIALVGWLAAGYMRSAMFGAPGAASAPAHHGAKVGAVEIGVALGALDVLFLGFVLVQLRYLFGGDAHVAATAGVGYAEYARSGFFELVWVTALVLPLLLVADALLRSGDRAAQLTFRLLAATLLVLLGVVMLSAMERMWLYERAYGLTGTRLYASAAMAWLALVFAWFAATVLRGRRAPFAFGALVSAWVVVAALDVMNPDALIARTNLSRLERGERFDALYLTQLSDDATPRVLEAVTTIPEGQRCAVVKNLLWRLHAGQDWRGWNLARATADGALATHAGELAALRCAEATASGGS